MFIPTKVIEVAVAKLQDIEGDELYKLYGKHILCNGGNVESAKGSVGEAFFEAREDIEKTMYEHYTYACAIVEDIIGKDEFLKIVEELVKDEANEDVKNDYVQLLAYLRTGVTEDDFDAK